jgi:hypothetical protein
MQRERPTVHEEYAATNTTYPHANRVDSSEAPADVIDDASISGTSKSGNSQAATDEAD